MSRQTSEVSETSEVCVANRRSLCNLYNGRRQRLAVLAVDSQARNVYDVILEDTLHAA
jgi:hypothetical protein